METGPPMRRGAVEARDSLWLVPRCRGQLQAHRSSQEPRGPSQGRLLSQSPPLRPHNSRRQSAAQEAGEAVIPVTQSV